MNEHKIKSFWMHNHILPSVSSPTFADVHSQIPIKGVNRSSIQIPQPGLAKDLKNSTKINTQTTKNVNIIQC